MGGNNTTQHINDAMNQQVANATQLVSAAEAAKIVDSRTNMVYVDADVFIGNPYALLGSVIEVRKTGDKCPDGMNAPGTVIEFSTFPIQGIKIDEASKIKEPIKRQSIMVDAGLSLQVGLLSYLNAELKDQSTFSIMVFDQATGVINMQDDSWNAGVKKWKDENQDVLNNPDICYLYIVIGFVQKYIIRKKFHRFDVSAKGGAFGVNLNGQLYTSSEDYSLDIRYGLQPVILKRPAGKGADLGAAPSLPNRDDLKMLHAMALAGRAVQRKKP